MLLFTKTNASVTKNMFTNMFSQMGIKKTMLSIRTQYSGNSYVFIKKNYFDKLKLLILWGKNILV